MGYRPWGHKELDMTEELTLSLSNKFIFNPHLSGCKGPTSFFILCTGRAILHVKKTLSVCLANSKCSINVIYYRCN